METALYFPYMAVPQTPWFTQVLLYWDRAATIMPDSRKEELLAKNPYMSELDNSHFLEYIKPDHHLWPGNVQEEFYNGFLDLLGDTEGPIPDSGFSRVHIDKLPVRLFQELERRELATKERGEEWDSYWQVEATTADKYMAYLASVISGARIDTYPVTDSEVKVAMLNGTANGDIKDRLSVLRYAAITEAAGAPGSY
jgi:hypothetical protein